MREYAQSNAMREVSKDWTDFNPFNVTDKQTHLAVSESVNDLVILLNHDSSLGIATITVIEELNNAL